MHAYNRIGEVLDNQYFPMLRLVRLGPYTATDNSLRPAINPDNPGSLRKYSNISEDLLALIYRDHTDFTRISAHQV